MMESTRIKAISNARPLTPRRITTSWLDTNKNQKFPRSKGEETTLRLKKLDVIDHQLKVAIQNSG